MGLFSKTVTIPASKTYQELEGTVLPAGTSAYEQMLSTPMQNLQAPQDMFGNADLYALQQARGEAVSPMGYQASFTDPQRAAISQMAQGTAGFQDPYSGDLFNQYLQKYQDPYQQQVIDPTLRDIREQGDIGQARLGEAATAAGGFGGSRQALESSLLEGQTQRNIADMGGRLRSQGINTAMDRAFQDYMGGQDVYGRGLQQQLGAGGMLQQQGQKGLDIARGFQTQPAEWYQQFLNKMPASMITPEQKIQKSSGLGKALGALQMGSSLLSGGMGLGGMGSMFGPGGGGGGMGSMLAPGGMGGGGLDLSKMFSSGLGGGAMGGGGMF